LNLNNADNVLTVRETAPAGWEQWILCRSDAHHDSPFCDRKLEKRHLDEAKQKGAWIIDYGDLADAMQGHNDPRASYDNLDPELKGDNYFDRVVEFNSKFYGPYAQNFIMIAPGNHEMSVLKHHNRNLTSNLVYALNMEHGGHITVGGYGGYIRFMFTMDKTKKASLILKYFHGAGGEAPVTKGVIQSQRQAVKYPDADIVVNGHNHQEYIVGIGRERISQAGQIYTDIQYHIRTPGYKNSWGNGASGFEVEAGMDPKPIGAIWLKLYREENKIRVMAVQDIR
jgi:predicted phosphodiesterase